jgi:hypothetical protein
MSGAEEAGRSGAPPSVDIVDDTFVVAGRSRLAALFADPGTWQRWWPDLDLAVDTDRGLEGIRWTVAGRYPGSAEIWLEKWRDGVIVHWYLRVEPHPGGGKPDQLRRRLAMDYKRRIHALKDELERDRHVGGTSRKRGR